MHPSFILRARTPLIRFLGKRSIPANIDHSVRPHPAAPSALPKSFLAGPSLQKRSASNFQKGGIEPKQGEFFDRSELPARFRRLAISVEEMEAVELGGAI